MSAASVLRGASLSSGHERVTVNTHSQLAKCREDSCLISCSLPGGERQVASTIHPGLLSNWDRALEHLSPFAGLCPQKGPLLLCEKKKKPHLH
ncbi:hypothetical protein LEMLEM_LOCUS21759, partial [Lemmus lemmus]